MLSRLVLPPTFSVRIDLDPDKAPLSATVTIFRAGVWMAEITARPDQLEGPNDLQEIVDMYIRRGVHLTLEADR